MMQTIHQPLKSPIPIPAEVFYNGPQERIGQGPSWTFTDRICKSTFQVEPPGDDFDMRLREVRARFKKD